MKAAEERAEQVGRWLARTPDGAATPAEIGAALGFNHARRAEAIGVLRRTGWVDGPKARPSLTSSGWARFLGLADSQAGGEVLGQVLERWPSQSGRSFLQLLVSTIVARHHLGAAQPSGHLAFLVLGETGTGKTAAARLVCDLFGWDYAEHELFAPAQTAGDLLGRRVQVEGGRGEVAWVPAPATRRPFLLLDELDKADPEARRLAWTYAHGERRTTFAGQVHELLSTAMLAANPPRDPRADRYGVLRPEYRRRSVVLDTSSMRGRGRELGQVLDDRSADPRRPRLSLDALVPPAAVLPLEADGVLEQLEDCLTDAGREEYPGLRSLRLATLGRWGLLGPEADPVAAAFWTAFDYLHVAETQPGQVRPGWQPSLSDLHEWLGKGLDAAQLAQQLEQGRRDRQEALQGARQARVGRSVVDLEIQERSGALAASYARLRADLDARKLQKLPTETRDRAAGARQALRTLAEKAGKVRTMAGLEDVRAEGAATVQRAQEILAALERVRREDQRQREQQQRDRDQERRDREADARRAKVDQAVRRQQAKSAREYGRAQLGQLEERLTRLEGWYRRVNTKPGESPLRLLAAEGLVRWQPFGGGQGRGLDRVLDGLDRVLDAVTRGPQLRGSWVAPGLRQQFPGSERDCEALRRWGPATKAILEPTIRQLHAEVAGWRRQLGLKPRPARV